MRFLIDEMFSPDIAVRLREAGHDAEHVVAAGLGHTEDAAVMAYAVAHDRVVVTENAVDFLGLLEERTAEGEMVVPVVVALKRRFPRGAGARAHHLTQRLCRWAEEHPTPFRHVHWLD